MTTRGLSAEQRTLCLAARSRPTAEAGAELETLLRSGIDWDSLWGLAHLHEVVPLVGATVSSFGGETVPADWRDRALRRRHVTMRANAHLAEALGDVLGALGAAGVEAMPVKGLVLAEHLYGDIAARPCADLDVLVRPRDLAPAREALRSIGFQQRAAPGYKALVHQFHDPAWGRGSGTDHVRLELHWALWADSERRLGTDGLWDRSVAATLAGRPIRMLSPEDTLLHLAIHRTRSALRLRWVVDVAELVRRYGDALDWSAYLDRAGRAGARTASWVILGLARDLLDSPVPDDVMARLAVGWPKRSLLERTCGATALFRPADDGSVAQQPHLVLRSLEEDGIARIGLLAGRSALRPLREALHDAGVIRARRTAPS
jgi:putative nucleotidyltransferase-like protein